MDIAAPRVLKGAATVRFEDGLGKRFQADGPLGEPLEVLVLRDHLSTADGFEDAIRQQVKRIAGFRHPGFGHVRGIARVVKSESGLAVISDRVDGTRLSDLLAAAEKRVVPLHTMAAVWAVREIVAAIASFHESVPDVCHGAISPERIIVTPDARVIIVEHVFGGALPLLRFSRPQYWKDLRVALPQADRQITFDPRADVTQTAVVALALMLGYAIGDDLPAGMVGSADGATIQPIAAALDLVPGHIRPWMSRALPIDGHEPFTSAIQARRELDRVLDNFDYAAAADAFRAFVAACHGIAAPQPAPSAHREAATPRAGVVTPHPAAIATPTPGAAVTPKPAVLTPTPAPVITPTPAAVATPTPAAVLTPKPAVVTPPPRIETTPPAPVESPVARATDTPSRPVMTKERAPMAPVMRPPLKHEDATPEHVAPSRRRLIAAAAAVLILLSGGGFAAFQYFRAPAAEASSGTLVVETDPAGIAVAVDGQDRGRTPLRLELAPGAHQLVATTATDRRSLTVNIAAGTQVAQFIEMPKAPVVAETGQLQVRTEPSGARVIVDGQPRGVSPLTIDALAAGVHTVTLEGELGSVTENVTVDAGTVSSLIVPLTAPRGAPVSGWIAVTAPAEVQLYENRRLLGSSRSERIMASVGRHEIEIVNETLGFRTARVVNVNPGQVTTVGVDWPKGAMAINALPWADVWLDGEHIGETPIGNVQVPIGTHDVLFRHPELGEQRHNVVVTAAAPARVSADLRKR